MAESHPGHWVCPSCGCVHGDEDPFIVCSNCGTEVVWTMDGRATPLPPDRQRHLHALRYPCVGYPPAEP